MSLPNEVDFALIKMGDGASPEVFTTLCGITDCVINGAAATQDRYVRDCTKPGEVPVRKTKITGKSLEVQGTGLSNADEIDTLESALGEIKNYKIELYHDDGTDAGDLQGTYSGAFRLTASNLNDPRDNTASRQVTLVNDGPWTYTAA